MILSVSRRTDIPAFYSQWFLNRIREGYVYVRNPFNYNRISKVIIKPDNVDCIVFWTKNPRPLMNKLDELDKLNFKYYFQFTITPYQEDIEKNVMSKKEIIQTFIELSNRIGKRRVILRYDPIILTERYNLEFHKKAFRVLCDKLHSYTEKVIFSFLDGYKKIAKNMQELNVREISNEDMKVIAGEFVKVAEEYGLSLETCAEKIDLRDIGIKPARCIDGDLIERIIGYKIMNKDILDGNREHCGCMKCIDIGQYDSCIHNCLYCYANVNKDKALNNYKIHNPKSPILFGDFEESQVKERKDVKGFKVIEDENNLLGN
jgi:DNA repair photolyase